MRPLGIRVCGSVRAYLSDVLVVDCFAIAGKATCSRVVHPRIECGTIDGVFRCRARHDVP